jgi:5-bromo-4-chloroindolyl phosphate hydrolysis protein
MIEKRPERASSVATRVSSRDQRSGHGRSPDGHRRAWTLRVAPILLMPLVLSLIAGSVPDVVGLAIGLACFVAAVFMVEGGLASEAIYRRRTISRAPRLPRKLVGALLVGGGAFFSSLLASTSGLPLSILFGAVGVAGTLLAYGLDPRTDKGPDADRAAKSGVRLETVVEAITEAETKIDAIERSAGRLRNRELKEHLESIADQARGILTQIEQDPGDIRRARRFLVTYLDGTRNVVEGFARQQNDLEDTPLAENFSRVLQTVEQVFREQEEVLKRNESLDLEVKIDVLKTQMEKEGVA